MKKISLITIMKLIALIATKAQCLKITQNVSFEFLNSSIFHQMFSFKIDFVLHDLGQETRMNEFISCYTLDQKD